MPSLSEKKYSNSSFYITKSSESNEERAKVHIHSLPIYGQTVNHIGNRFFFCILLRNRIQIYANAFNRNQYIFCHSWLIHRWFFFLVCVILEKYRHIRLILEFKLLSSHDYLHQLAYTFNRKCSTIQIWKNVNHLNKCTCHK